MATAVPPVQFTLTGLVLPQEADILTGVQTDWNGAFGGNLNPALETPQGQVESSETAIVGASNDLFAFYVNQVDPAFASGRMQDAIGYIYFLDRKPAIPTAVQCDCVGLAGTVIPTGALAIDTANNQYACTGGGTIPTGGTISLPFACLTTGPIVCPANQLNRIYQAITGWESINNPGNGVPGSLVESRGDFEFRRQNSVALNGKGSLPSIYANVFNVPNVLDVYTTENVSNIVEDFGSTNYPLAPHSLYVAAVGGDPTAIANAIWLKKDVGCDYNGNTTVTVFDSQGYNPPYPSYLVKFNIPTSEAIFFAVTIANNTNLPADLVTQVQNAILNAFVGGDGGPRARIGSTIFASRFYCGISAISPFVGITALLVGIGSATAPSVTMGIDQVPTCVATNISVTLV